MEKEGNKNPEQILSEVSRLQRLIAAEEHRRSQVLSNAVETAIPASEEDKEQRREKQPIRMPVNHLHRRPNRDQLRQKNRRRTVIMDENCYS